MTSAQVTFRMEDAELAKMREAMADMSISNTSEFVRRAIMHKIRRECA